MTTYLYQSLQCKKKIEGVNHVTIIRVKINDENNIGSSLRDIKDTLREQHGIDDQSGTSDDFTVRSGAQALDLVTTITNALKFFLSAMAAISLVVGGIGIMNIMLISVTERTKEIGLRKAIGAKSSDILSQFLFESITLTVIGGIIGIIVGSTVSLIIYLVVAYLGYDWELKISLLSIVVAVSVSASIGLIFGLYPANKASKLEPIEALRHE